MIISIESLICLILCIYLGVCCAYIVYLIFIDWRDNGCGPDCFVMFLFGFGIFVLTGYLLADEIAQVKTDLAIRDYVEAQYDIEVDDITYYTRDKENDKTVCSGEIFPSGYVYTAILDEDMNICEMSLYQTTESDKDEKDVFEEKGITITGEIPAKE